MFKLLAKRTEHSAEHPAGHPAGHPARHPAEHPAEHFSRHSIHVSEMRFYAFMELFSRAASCGELKHSDIRHLFCLRIDE